MGVILMGKHTTEMKMVETSKLIPYVNNARTHSQEQVNNLRGSLREFGFINPVIIDSDFNVIAGHGRLMAAKEEGIEEVPCVLVDYLTEAQKKAYILADNRYAQDAGWDEEMLKLLTTTEGFRKLVYAIGITVETENPDEIVYFAFQMYGKTDPYGSGTTIRVPVKADGMEQKVKLDEVDWSDDDDIPGQIRFEFAKANTQAKVAVRFLLQDGFDAPEPEEEGTVDFECSEYQEMLRKSLMQTGNNHRIKRTVEKARRGEDVTVAFIGGSITQGAGAIPINNQCYAWKTFELQALRKRNR